MSVSATPDSLLQALVFASAKHRLDHRKDREESPYINHPINVAAILTRSGVQDAAVLQAAFLHDTIEDTETTGEELERTFGSEVRRIVEEVTDDKALPKAERKDRQVRFAGGLSAEAKLVRIADKAANIWEIVRGPPAKWDRRRRQEYLLWAEQVVARCKGVNPELESLFDEALDEAREVLGGS